MRKAQADPRKAQTDPARRRQPPQGADRPPAKPPANPHANSGDTNVPPPSAQENKTFEKWSTIKMEMSFFLALVGYCFHLGFQCFLVAEIVFADDLEIIVEFIDKGNAGRDVDPDDILFTDILEVFHEGAE